MAIKYAGKNHELLKDAQTEIAERFPDSFLHYYTEFQMAGWSDEGIAFLEKALAIDDSQPLAKEDQLVRAELLGIDRKRHAKELFEAGLIHASTLNYSYNLLMSVAQDGLLIVDGLHLTIPIWVLQDAMNVRTDVAILNLELATQQETYARKMLVQNGFDNTIDGLLSGKQSDKVYYALTLPRAILDQSEKDLYVVGLASTTSEPSFNHFKVLQKNMEHRFLMDYLSIDFNGEPKTATGRVLATNYLVPLLLLKDFYVELKEDQRSNELTEQIRLLSKDTQMETRVRLLLNENKSLHEFKYVELNVKELDKQMKLVKGNVYASKHELKNKEYWFFMEYLRTNGYNDLYNQFLQDLSKYDEVTQSLLSRYHYSPVNFKELKSRYKKQNQPNYPALDFTHEAAKAYCEWLTVQYNGNEKRAFKKVRFRLPEQEEWTMAALGFNEFQSWQLEENVIRARTGKDKATEKSYDLSKNRISYPWAITAWDLRNSVMNRVNCYLANVKVDEKIVCPAGIKGDGWTFTSPVETYFSNEMGLYDMIGNVAEMVSEPGIAMGGSWNDTPENATISSSYSYEGSDVKVGMRLFMEVIEE